MERRRPSAPLPARVILWSTLIFLYLPIVVMILGALVVRENERWALTVQWFGAVLNDEALMAALRNSLFVSFCASSLSTVIGTLAVLGLRQNQRVWAAIVRGLSVTSLIFPEIVFALSLLSWFFILKIELGLTTVILAHVSFSVSYVMMTVGARLATLDASYEDAARDLGATEWKVQSTVVIPLLGTAILGGFILSFLLSFDDFLITYFVNGVGQDTLPVKLYTAMKMGVSPKLNALSSLMFLMTLSGLIFFFRSSAFRVLFEGNRGENGSSTEEKNI